MTPTVTEVSTTIPGKNISCRRPTNTFVNALQQKKQNCVNVPIETTQVFNFDDPPQPTGGTGVKSLKKIRFNAAAAAATLNGGKKIPGRALTVKKVGRIGVTHSTGGIRKCKKYSGAVLRCALKRERNEGLEAYDAAQSWKLDRIDCCPETEFKKLNVRSMYLYMRTDVFG